MNEYAVIIKSFAELTLDELYAILQCRSEVFGMEQEILYVDPDDMDQASVHIYVTDGQGKMASYLRVIPPGVKFPHAASIGRVLTLPHWRGRGLARLLMEKAIDTALAMSDKIEIEAQAYLHDFYTSLGFQPVSDVYILEGLPHVSMILSCSS